MWTNNKITGKKVFIGVIFLCILLFVLIMINARYCLNNNLNGYNSNQEQTIAMMLSDAKVISDLNHKNYSENIISLIESNFPTSSSVYCIVAMKGEIVYIKDRDTTKEYTSVEDYMIEQVINSNLEKFKLMGFEPFSFKSTLSDQRKYLVSIGFIEYEDSDYQLSICTRQGYIISKLNMDVYQLQLFIYTLLLIIAFVSFVFLILRRTKKIYSKIAVLEEENQNSRLLIEKLHDDMNESANLGNQMYGFFPRQLVKNIIMNLDEEKRNNSVVIHITVNSRRSNVNTYIATLLERMRFEKSISCQWEYNDFVVLLLNSKEIDAERFIQCFRYNYVLCFEEAADICVTYEQPIMEDSK